MSLWPGAADDLTSGVPDDATAVTEPLGSTGFPHDDHHRALGEAVEAVQGALPPDPGSVPPPDWFSVSAGTLSLQASARYDTAPPLSLTTGGYIEVQFALDPGYTLVVSMLGVACTAITSTPTGLGFDSGIAMFVSAGLPPTLTFYGRARAVDYYGNVSAWVNATAAGDGSGAPVAYTPVAPTLATDVDKTGYAVPSTPVDPDDDGKVWTADSGAATWVTPTAPPSAPGGSDTEVQFNDGGTLAGDSAFVFNKTTNRLTVGGSGVVGGAYFPDVTKNSYVAIGPQGNFGPDYAVDLPHLALNTARIYADGSGGIVNFRDNAGNWGTIKTGYIYAELGYVTANGRVGFVVQENFNNSAAVVGVGVTPAFTPQARLYVQPEAAHISFSAGIDTIRAKAQTSQTGRLFRAVSTSDGELWSVDQTGAMKPASMADSAAANDRVYFSTDAGKLVYKTSTGGVNALY